MRGSLRGRLVGVVATLLVVLVSVACSTLFARFRVASADHAVDQVWAPARSAAAALSAAYVDQETGERGFLLTGAESFLQPYRQGRTGAATATEQLGGLLSGDLAGTRLLHAVSVAGEAWTSRAAAPEIAARRGSGPVSQGVLFSQAAEAKRLFDALRGRLTALSDHINQRAAQEVGRAHSAQTVANWVAAGAMGLALVVAGLSAIVLRRSVRRPVSRMLDQVQAVADGRLDHPVEVAGPAEVAAVAEAVEAMRLRLLSDMESAAEVRERLAILEEAERIARDLHDRVIQHLFAAGIQLESTAARHPDAAASLREVVDDLDQSIRELRTVIFGLTSHQATGQMRERVTALVRDSQRSLGFTPHLHLEGPLDTMAGEDVADELVPSLGEVLSNIARHAHATEVDVRLSLADGMVKLVVTDDGVGIPPDVDGAGRGLRNIRERASLLGGSCRLAAGPQGGTLLEWSVPVG